MAKIPPGVGPRFAQVVVLFGATGDLARRKLLPGLYHLASAGFIPGCRIIGVSLDDIDSEGFRTIARAALDEHFIRKVTDSDWEAFARSLDYVPLAAGAAALKAAVDAAELSLGVESRRLHYLSVPPNAALSAVRLLGEAQLVERSRIVMEKPFGTDLASAVSLNGKLHEVFAEDQIFRIDHFLGKEPAQNILAFRFANGLFEPNPTATSSTTCRSTCRKRWAWAHARPSTSRPAPTATWWSRTCSRSSRFMAMEPPTAPGTAAHRRREEQGLSQHAAGAAGDVVRGQYTGYRDEDGVDPESETETFIALKCFIDNWRWAGVPFFLRTGKRLAEGQRIISIAFREPPKSMFPAGSGVGAQGPDHLTFDLADASKTSADLLRQAPGAGHAPGQTEPAVRHARHRLHGRGAGSLRAPDPRRHARRPHAVQHGRGHRAFVAGVHPPAGSAAAGAPLPPGSWGPKSIHQLIAPHAWRLPFERAWRPPNPTGGAGQEN